MVFVLIYLVAVGWFAGWWYARTRDRARDTGGAARLAAGAGILLVSGGLIGAGTQVIASCPAGGDDFACLGAALVAGALWLVALALVPFGAVLTASGFARRRRLDRGTEGPVGGRARPDGGA